MLKSISLSACALALATSANAYTLDFTDALSFSFANRASDAGETASTAFIARGVLPGTAAITWELTATPASRELTYNLPESFNATAGFRVDRQDQGYDGGPDNPGNLVRDGDGIGVRIPGNAASDEVTFPAEFLTLTFSKKVGVLAFSVLDLFKKSDGSDREEAFMQSGATLLGSVAGLEASAGNATGGFASSAVLPVRFDTDVVTFVGGPGLDDQIPDFALASIELFSSDGQDVPETPLPAAGFVLLGALGGLAALRRRRKS